MTTHVEAGFRSIGTAFAAMAAKPGAAAAIRADHVGFIGAHHPGQSRALARHPQKWRIGLTFATGPVEPPLAVLRAAAAGVAQVAGNWSRGAPRIKPLVLLALGGRFPGAVKDYYASSAARLRHLLVSKARGGAFRSFESVVSC